MHDDMKAAQDAIAELQAGSAKLAGMVTELQKDALPPEQKAELFELNQEIVSKLASAGLLKKGADPTQTAQTLMHPLALADVTLKLLEQQEAHKSAASPMSLGRPSDGRKQSSAPAPAVITSHRKEIRC